MFTKKSIWNRKNKGDDYKNTSDNLSDGNKSPLKKNSGGGSKRQKGELSGQIRQTQAAVIIAVLAIQVDPVHPLMITIIMIKELN